MDWNLKAPSWDLSEVDQASLSSNIETVDGSNRFGSVYGTKGEFSVDLKLGHHVGNSGSTESVLNKSKMTSSSSASASASGSGSSKRARAINNGSQTVSCLVDGCQADLSNCRDYHRRHKVCELHSKTAQVTIGGNKQRFCQQCSRFHSLEEFDEGKRSCRKRLDGHNRRRRKPQPEGFTRSGGFLSNYQGTQLLPFSSSHVYPSTALVNPVWGVGGGVVTSCADVIRLHNHNQQVHQQDLFIGSSPTRSYKEGIKQLAFMQQGDQNQHFPVAAAANSMSLTSSSVVHHDSSCALSLLSSPSPQTQNNHMMVNHPHSSSSSSFMQPLGLSLHDPVLGPNGSSNTHDHCSSIYNNMASSDQSQPGNNEAPPLFPFQWE